MVSSMTGNQVVSTMFDFNTCNHMVRFVLWATKFKTLDIILLSKLRWNIYNLWHIDPLCMSRGYVVLIWIFSHRSTVYFWWLCYILTARIHNVWLVAMTYVYNVIRLWSEYGNAYLKTSMIFRRCLVVCRFLIRCAPGFWHTHTIYNVFQPLQILAS